MANALYDKGREAFLSGAINFSSDTIKMVLVKNTYTPSLSTHQYFSDLGANTIGTPQTLGGKSVTAGVANCSNVTFSAVTTGSTVTYIAVYKDTGTPTTAPLICLIDTAVGVPLATNGGDIIIAIDTGANKLFKL